MVVNMIFIKKEKEVGTVTDYYIETIGEAFKEEGQDVSYIYEWNQSQFKKNDLAVVITATQAMKMIFYNNDYIFWAQGVWPEESKMRNNNHLRYTIASFIEKRALSKAKFVFFVSDTQRKYYENKYRLSFDNYFIMPCSNEKLHEAAFFKENKYKNNVFCYAGSMSPWQCVDETIKFYSKIEQKYKDTKLLLLVKDKEKALQLMEKYSVKNYEIDYVPIEKLEEKLSEVKFGFVLRKNSPINYVATPTKIMTYMANGVIPIYSQCLEGINIIMKNTKYKVILTENYNVGIIQHALEDAVDPMQIFKEYKKIYGEFYDRDNNKKKIKEKFRSSHII